MSEQYTLDDKKILELMLKIKPYNPLQPSPSICIVQEGSKASCPKPDEQDWSYDFEPPEPVPLLEEFKQRAQLAYKESEDKFKRPDPGLNIMDDSLFELYKNLEESDRKKADDYIQDLEIQRLEYFKNNPITSEPFKFS